MKKFQLTKVLFAVVVMGGAIALTSCGGGKAISDGLGKKIVTPCSDNEYPSTKTHFRGTGIAESTNLSAAKRKANMDANDALAASVNRTIKSVQDRYTNDVTVGASSEFSEKFEQMTRSVVNQELNNVAAVCNETRQLEGKYIVYVAVEVAKDELLNKITTSISKDDKLKLDYDKMKFENIFNQEMDALAKSQGR